MYIKRSSIWWFIAANLFLLSIISCERRFDKNRFLSACHFSIDDNLLTDAEEYNEIYSGRWRDPQVDSLYRLFQQTHDYELNLQICHSFGKGYFLRDFGRGTDSLLADNFFARAINASKDRDEIINLILIYGWDKPYSVQKAIGEECLKSQYYVNDSLKYIALNYAIDGNYNQDNYDLDIIRDYSRERMKVAAKVFGDESSEAYNALFECAQLTQFENGTDVDMVDSLFRYHKTHAEHYRQGRIWNLSSDPLYLRYISCLLEGDINYAYEILTYLTEEVVYNQDNSKNFYESSAESEIMLMYENARLRFLFNKPSYKSWIDGAVQKTISYLSPTGGYVDLIDYLKPDYSFSNSLVDLMGLGYNTPSTEDAYNTALFIKGTSALIAPDLIRLLESHGQKDLISYVDSLRQNYRRYPFAGMGIGGLKDPVVWAHLNREVYYEQKLESFVSNINPSSVWKRCNLKYDDVYRALKLGESAVEIIKTYPFAKGDAIYEALIINYGNPKPIRKEICDSRTLIKLFQAGHLYDDKPNPWCEQIIEPLLSAVTGTTVYISSSGLFSLINIASISNENGERVSDGHNIINCISTKEICDKRNRIEPKTFSSVALFGGLEFEKGNHTSHFSDNNTVERDIERDGFGFLPASLEEVEAIDSIANQHNIRSFLYTGIKGTEAEFRSFSGKNVSIIHLATHGFYYNTIESVSKGYANLINDGDIALNRCGIILANGQYAWKNGIDQYDNNNGILLGSEIANLNLLNTDLVVLSACNTGLGDISNEGISGLQQAFKHAGVRALLLTLKPISDDATKLFMIEFYEHLFAGEPLQNSYYAAVNRLKAHPLYGNPDCWSSYVLLI